MALSKETLELVKKEISFSDIEKIIQYVEKSEVTPIFSYWTWEDIEERVLSMDKKFSKELSNDDKHLIMHYLTKLDYFPNGEDIDYIEGACERLDIKLLDTDTIEE